MKYIKSLILAAFIMLFGSCKHLTTHKEKAVKIHSYQVKKDKAAGPNSTPGILATSPEGTTDTYLYIIWAGGVNSNTGIDSYIPGRNCYSYSSPTPVTDFKTASFTYGKAPELAEDEELAFDQIVNEQLDDLMVAVQEAIGSDSTVQKEEVNVDDSTGETVSESTEESSTEGSSTEGSSSGSSSDDSGSSSSGSDSGGSSDSGSSSDSGGGD